MRTEFVKLGDVCEFNYGDSLREDKRRAGQVPVYGSNGIVGWHDEAITHGPTIIVGRKGSIGEVNFSDVACYPIDTTYYIEATKQLCDLRWLYYALIALDLTKLNKSAAIPGLNRDDAYEKKIPSLQLAEQQHIAAILDRADRLRRTRRYAAQLSDSFLQTVFIEMFGDPQTNPMKWDVVTLEDAILSTKNGFGRREDFSKSGVIVLRIREVGSGFIDYSEPRRITMSLYEISDYHLEDGDVLLVRVNGNPDLVGRAALFTSKGEPVAFNDHIIRVRVDPAIVNPIFFVNLLNNRYGRQQVRSAVTTTAGQFTINHTGISRIALAFPPLALQEKFARIVQQFDRLRAQQREADRQAEMLFGALLDRAFAGEL